MTQAPNPSKNAPWAADIDTFLHRQHVDPAQGLSAQDVETRRKQAGSNRLRTRSRENAWEILARQFKGMIVWLLIVSAGLSFAFGEWIDAAAILVVIVINALIGFLSELQAVRSMEALREMSQVDARVRREGELRQIPAEQLVPGDVVVVEGGDIVTADLRLVEASKLQANESALTGESQAVSKATEAIAADTPLAERRNMLFKGTSVTRGSGIGVVASTGMDTELGNISKLVTQTGEERTPLEKRLDRLGSRLAWLALGIIPIVVATGVLRGKDLLLMIETAVALAVAAVPEGLPIVATLALARGMRRMADHNALLNRLASVETLGGTNVICTDKTGTLTENRMTVTQYVLESGTFFVTEDGLESKAGDSAERQPANPQENPRLLRALQIGVLCSNAEFQHSEQGERQAIGEPVEVALLVAGAKAGLSRAELLEAMPEAREVAFDADVKMMATYHEHEGGYLVLVKGAPEAVLEVSSQRPVTEGQAQALDEAAQKTWLDANQRLAAEGLRLLGLAYKHVDSVEAAPYEGLSFLGLVAMQDPPRREVRPALEDCRKAGIQVVMVTGDHAVTARNIAEAVGLVGPQAQHEVILGEALRPPQDLGPEERRRFLEAVLFARVSPRQKLDLIANHQADGSVVAMTGDGVNDAPALKKADIGVAMGQRGTQVAREAADMVLQDDSFATIVVAIRLGREIFNNIRRFVLYLISCNASEIAVIFLATLVNLPLPIQPLQILFLNLVTDVFPALALGASKGDPMVMERPPRDPQEPVLRKQHWLKIGAFSLAITLVVLSAYGLASRWLGMDEARTVTISFLTLAFAQLWHVFNMRERGSSFLHNDVFQNRYVWGAIVLCVFLLLGAVYLPPVATVLDVVNPGAAGWALILGMSLIPWALGQAYASFPMFAGQEQGATNDTEKDE
ncbi:MAG: cation-translocating P-type ATPase [Chloroflexota bacterium]